MKPRALVKSELPWLSRRWAGGGRLKEEPSSQARMRGSHSRGPRPRGQRFVSRCPLASAQVSAWLRVGRGVRIRMNLFHTHLPFLTVSVLLSSVLSQKAGDEIFQ